MGSRKGFIDAAKGIGIILVVLGHLDASGQLSRNIIYSFHMPLFFLLSGVFSNTNGDFKSYFKKNFLSLFVPYIIFVAVDAIACIVIGGINTQNLVYVAVEKAKELFGIGFGALNRPIWFFFALFVVKLAYYFISKAAAIKIVSIAAGIIFVILGKAVSYRPDFLWLVSVPCLSFYALGDIFRAQILKIDTIAEKKKPLFSVLTVGLVALLAFSAGENLCVDMTMYKYGNAALFFANAIAGSLALIMLSALLSEKWLLTRIIVFYGKNSAIVMVCHYYFCRRILPSIMEKLSLSQYLYSAVTQLVVLVLILAALVPVILFSNKYIPFVFGKFKKRVIE